MKVVHVLRKYNPAEWGGTESALQRLFHGLQPSGVSSIVYCPRTTTTATSDPLAETGCTIKRFRACVPIWGISKQQREQMIAVGGNLISFQLLASLWRESGVSLIHTHTLGRIGAIALTIARKRRVPCVLSIHGGVLDLPQQLKESFDQPVGGVEWGKLFGLLLQSRRLLSDVDAVITCNEREAAKIREKFPGKRVQTQSHGVPAAVFARDHRMQADEAFPSLRHKRVLLCVGRIDSVKNQLWLIDRMPALAKKHPNAVLALAGACTDQKYGDAIQRRIRDLALEEKVILAGAFGPNDPRLIGLMQNAAVVLLPSVSETFGLVILEAWAAGTAVISSRTSGASALVKPGENGWLFDLESPESLHLAVNEALSNEPLRSRFAANGHHIASTRYDTQTIAQSVRRLYEELIEEKHALRHST
jgi:alpha-maltose-1-phosphate synthase